MISFHLVSQPLLFPASLGSWGMMELCQDAHHVLGRPCHFHLHGSLSGAVTQLREHKAVNQRLCFFGLEFLLCVCVCVCVCVSHSAVSDSLQRHGARRLLRPWDSPGKNTGVDSYSLLQGIFLIQGSNPGLLHCRLICFCFCFCF